MTKWEYLKVEFIFFDEGNTAIMIKVNDEIVFHDPKKPTHRYSYITQLGKDGWEMASKDISVDGEVLYFKRPLAE